ncbi:MAG: pirin family protein [Bacteroidales bacterium]
MQTRPIKTLLKSKPTLEGAGVHLKRAFGYYEVPQFDPFLLMDDFRNDEPNKYLRGFPWHPHRGIETITYMLEGFAEHGDSMGNKGTIGPGDIQWMTAGSGIIHQEMPKPGPDGKMYGFQLWANLPASNKMMHPRYQDVKAADIPELILENGVKIRVICGEINGIKGPVRDIIIDPEYLDITVPPDAGYVHPTKKGYTVFAYVIGGDGETGRHGDGETGRHGDGETGRYGDGETGRYGDGETWGKGENFVENEMLVLFEDGDQVSFKTGGEPMRFLLISGKPLSEPIAWGGPIVMNTTEELDLAFEEYRRGTFIR